MAANEARTKYEVKLKAIFENLILAATVGFEVRFVVFANSLPLILREKVFSVCLYVFLQCD